MSAVSNYLYHIFLIICIGLFIFNIQVFKIVEFGRTFDNEYDKEEITLSANAVECSAQDFSTCKMSMTTNRRTDQRQLKCVWQHVD